MDNIDGIPIIWDDADKLFGSLFPDGVAQGMEEFAGVQRSGQIASNFPSYEWKTYWSNELSDAFFNGNKVTGPDDPIEVTDETGIYNTLTPASTSILYADTNNNDKYDIGEKISFKIKVFVSEDGAKLLRAWHAVIPADDELLIFLENNKGDKNSGSQILGKVGTKAKNNIEENTKNKNIFDWVNKKYAISQKELTHLLESTGNKGWFMRTLQKVVKAVGVVVSWPTEKLSDLFFWAGEKIKKGLSIEENTWKNPPPDIKKWLVGKEKDIKNTFEDFFKDWQQGDPGKEQKKNISSFEKTINDVIKGIYVFLEKNKEKLPEILFATICGIINGIVDLIAGIFTIIGMLLKLIAEAIKSSTNLIADGAYYIAVITEYLDNIAQAISKVNWEKFIIDAFVSYFKFVYISLPQMLEKAVNSVTAVEVGYYTGFVGINIVICFVPLVDILQFTKIAKLAKPLQALFEIITKLVKTTGKFVAKSVAELFTLFDGFIDILKKGTEEIIAFVKKIFEAVRMWMEEFLGIKPKPSKEDLLKEWDSLAVSGRGRRFGQRLLKRDLKIIEEFLLELGFEMELFPAKGAFEIEGFLNTAGSSSILPEQAQAMFIYTTKNAKFCLREGCTQYEFFHELMHGRQAKDIGLARYYKLGGYGTSGELAKEMNVFEKVLQNKNLFTRNELKHAEWNINETRQSFGEAPISYDFDLNTIPIIRREIGIESIIKIK